MNIKRSLSLKEHWKNPSAKRLEGIKKISKAFKKLYKEGKFKHWAFKENAIEIRKKIGRKGKLNGMYGKVAWNRGKKHSIETRKKISLKAKLRKGNLNPNWKNGISFKPYSWEFNEEKKEFIKQRDHYHCQNCGISQDEHRLKYKMSLVIHHVDYDKENNKIENLITLCTMCNTRANGNRDYWKKYYQDELDKVKLYFVKEVN